MTASGPTRTTSDVRFTAAVGARADKALATRTSAAGRVNAGPWRAKYSRPLIAGPEDAA